MGEASQIKNLRKNLKLTQAEFARKIGVTKRTVGSWEQGTRAINSRHRKAICQALKIAENELFGGSSSNLIKITGSAAAGGIVTPDHPHTEHHPRKTAIDLGEISVAGTEGICVHGDSMFPLAKDGDIILFNRSLDIKNGDLVYIKLDDEQAFFKRYNALDPKEYTNFSKRLKRVAKGLPPRVLLQGINPAIGHTPILALKSEVKFIYKVVGIIFK